MKLYLMLYGDFVDSEITYKQTAEPSRLCKR